MALRLRRLLPIIALLLGACGADLSKDDAALADAAILIMKGWEVGTAEQGEQTNRRTIENGVAFTHIEKNALIATAVEQFQDVKDSIWQRERVSVGLAEKCVLDVRSAMSYSIGQSKEEFRDVAFEPPKAVRYDLGKVLRLDLDLVKRFRLWAKVDMEGPGVACTGGECLDKVTFRSKTAVRGDASISDQAALLEAFERAIQVVKKSCPLRERTQQAS